MGCLECLVFAIFALLNAVIFVECSLECQISPSEYEGLWAIWNATNGDGWAWNKLEPNSTYWYFPSSRSAPCKDKWQGLNCNITYVDIRGISNCSVSGLDLSFNFVGYIPSEIRNLNQLTKFTAANNFFVPSTFPNGLLSLPLLASLNLQNNSLTGTIPDDIRLLTALEELNLQSNSFTGKLPSAISDLIHLGMLDLSYNFLNGTIPKEYGDLINMSTIQLSDNRLTGSIPVDISFKKNLTSLSLANNFLVGSLPRYFNKIALINVSSNYLSGAIPTDYCRFQTLTVFEISQNRLEGTLPACLGNLTLLTNFVANNNNFNGTIPIEWGSMEYMNFLDLSYNRLEGTFPDVILKFTRIGQLLLGQNQFYGPLPSELGSLDKLLFLDISGNLWTGPLPSNLGNLYDLRLLTAYESLLSGPIPTSFQRLVLLSELSLYDNLLSSALPAQLADDVRLKYLTLQDNYFSHQLPSEIMTMKSLEYLEIQSNYLSGPNPLMHSAETDTSTVASPQQLLPTVIGNNITYLMASQNLFTGSLPTNFSYFHSLQYLYLDDNSLTGSLPLYNTCDEVSDPSVSVDKCVTSSLLQLSVFDNLLTGSIPAAVGTITTLTLLALSDNRLIGNLPSNLYQLQSLQVLNISGNDFSGQIDHVFPIGYASGFPNLTYIDFSNNSFTGTIPSAIFQSTALQVISLSSNCFSGTLPISICNSGQLQSIVMNSLSSGEHCKTSLPILSHYLKGIFPKQIMSGSIPTCLWSLPTLSTLHISGNGLSGFLPDVPLFDVLTNVELGGNTLTGTIPMNIQQHGLFQTLGLQQNKFTGLLTDNFIVSKRNASNNNDTNTTTTTLATINLKVNRLSGTVPSSFFDVNNVDVLTGNMFTCVSIESLPPSDPQSKYYSCGSVALNTALITWVVLVFGVVVLWVSFLVAVNRISKSSNSSLVYESKSIATLVNARRQKDIRASEAVIATTNTNNRGSLSGSATYKRTSESSPRDMRESFSSISMISSSTLIEASSSSSSRDSINNSNNKNNNCSNSNTRRVKIDTGLDCHSIEDNTNTNSFSTNNYTANNHSTSTIHFAEAEMNSKKNATKSRNLKFKDLVARIFVNTMLWHSVKLEPIRNRIHNTYQFLDVLRGVSNGMIVLSLLYVLVCIVMYIVFKVGGLKQEYSTQSMQYGWIVSSGFLHDYVPASSILIVVFFCLYLMCSSIRKRVQLSGDDIDFARNTLVDPTGAVAAVAADVANSEKVDDTIKSMKGEISINSGSNSGKIIVSMSFGKYLQLICRFGILPFCLQAINACATIAVNAIYVQATGEVSPNYLILLQSSISAFKIGWACLYVPWAMSHLHHFSTRSQLRHQVLMYIVVVVLSPVLAAVCNDQRCFYEAFQGSEAVTTSYDVPSISPQCTQYIDYNQGIGGGLTKPDIACVNLYESTTVYSTATPPFIYSYQCGSAILVDFVPVLVYTYVFSSIILPFIRFTILHTPFHALHKYMPHQFYQLFVANSLLDCDEEFITYKPLVKEVQSIRYSFRTASEPELIPLFDGSIIIAKRLLDFAIMLTFGLACPPLGLAVAFSVFINASIWILMIGKFLSTIGFDNQIAIDKLEMSTKELLKGAISGMWIVVVSVAIFWSIMLFDMVADVHGNYSGLVYVIVCLSAAPLLLFALLRLGDQYNTNLGDIITKLVSTAITSRLTKFALFAAFREDSVDERPLDMHRTISTEAGVDLAIFRHSESGYDVDNRNSHISNLASNSNFSSYDYGMSDNIVPVVNPIVNPIIPSDL